MDKIETLFTKYFYDSDLISGAHMLPCNNYLCTYDFDAGRYIIVLGEVGGGLALEIESFLGPFEMAASR
jgi:hypothetical protein